MKSENTNVNKLNFIAFLFDSGKIEESFYGETVFSKFIEGLEISNNSHKVIFSVGDIFDRHIYSDITPFTIRNEICTIEKSEKQYENMLFAFSVEDIETQIAISIDERLKTDFSAYIGMTSIDAKSTDKRKQFWKSLVRRFSIESTTITCFNTDEEENFGYSFVAKEKGFRVNCDGFSSDCHYNSNNELFSTRKSSFIQSVNQLEFSDGQNDSDRGILEMNYALVKEVGIAGVQIWKAIEDINCAYIPKENDGYVITDYIFTALYQAAQGVERLLKVIIELIMYSNEDEAEKQITINLLYGHNHPAMYDFISKKENVSLSSHCKKLLNSLYSFYSEARYHRYKYSRNDTLELKLLQDFGNRIEEKCFDEQIKHLFGKSLGRTVQALYKLIETLSRKINIYVYELPSDSVANFALKSYYGEDLYETLKRVEKSKKELLWFLMRDGNKLSATKAGNEIMPLPFEECYVADYVASLITNKDSCSMLYDFISESYDELVAQDKSKWKERNEAIDALVGNPNVIFDEEIESDSMLQETNEDEKLPF